MKEKRRFRDLRLLHFIKSYCIKHEPNTNVFFCFFRFDPNRKGKQIFAFPIRITKRTRTHDIKVVSLLHFRIQIRKFNMEMET